MGTGEQDGNASAKNILRVAAQNGHRDLGEKRLSTETLIPTILLLGGC